MFPLCALSGRLQFVPFKLFYAAQLVILSGVLKNFFFTESLETVVVRGKRIECFSVKPFRPYLFPGNIFSMRHVS